MGSSEVIEYRLEYEPHGGGQLAFHRSKKRFRLLACGRRWGKDRAVMMDVLVRLPGMMEENRGKGLVPNVLVWFVVPTYPLGQQLWAELKSFVPAGVVERVSESDMSIGCRGGAEIWVKSADQPERLVGVGLDIVAITEAGTIDERVWQESIRPTLSSPGRKGMALLNGTPKGKNWFYRAYLRGQDPLDVDWESWNLPTWTSPYVKAEEIEAARRELPERVFRQEYGAEFMEDTGAVFRHVDGCVQGALEEPIPGHGYVMGVDLAKHEDFTVIVVADRMTRRVVGFDRFNQIDYVIQKERIAHFAAKYNNARCWMDSTGVGDPILEDLQRMGVKVDGYGLNATSKKQLIDGLAISLDQENLRFPPLPQLLSELKAYEYETTKAGNVRMNAPQGYHDDCVIALALCDYGLRQMGAGLGVQHAPVRHLVGGKDRGRQPYGARQWQRRELR